MTFDWSYYEKVYGHYEKQNPDYKYDHYLNVIQNFQSQPLPLLDFGCAHGRFLSYLQRTITTDNLYGTDINREAIEGSPILLPSNHLIPGGYEVLSAFPPMKVITAWDVLEHVPNLEETLQALSNQLLPNGILVAVMPVYDGPLGPLVHLLDKDPTHIHKKSRRFWVEKLAQYFEIIHWHGILRYLIPRGPYIHLPTLWGRAMTPAVLVVGQKPLQKSLKQF